MLTTPTTELEAVNILLDVIGESPINSLENNGHVDAAKARSVLAEVNRSIQTMGWHWNTEKDLPIALSTPDKFAILPANTLRVSAIAQGCGRDIVQRGLRLYDRLNHTYAFTEPVKVELVICLDFEDLPQSARELLVMRAGRIFQQRSLGSGVLYQFTAQDEARALTDLMNAESESLGLNILTNSAVARVLIR